MTLYRIPWRWDYHGQSAIIVMANTAEEAIAKAKTWFESTYPIEEEGFRFKSEPFYDEIIVCGSGIAFDHGCDC